MSFLEDLKWRYAAKKMDPTKKVSEGDIDYIKETVQLAASSYGLQPYKVLEVNDPELRAQLKPLCWNQSQITDASHVFVFCNYTNKSDGQVDQYVRLRAERHDVPVEKLEGYGTFIKEKVMEKSDQEFFHWTAKQAYIAMTNAMTACAELKIDSTPMEGFVMDAVNELLQLPQKGLSASVILAIGYRSDEDQAQHNEKVRKPLTDIFAEV